MLPSFFFQNTELTCSGKKKCYMEIVECKTRPCYPQPVCAGKSHTMYKDAYVLFTYNFKSSA